MTCLLINFRPKKLLFKKKSSLETIEKNVVEKKFCLDLPLIQEQKKIGRDRPPITDPIEKRRHILSNRKAAQKNRLKVERTSKSIDLRESLFKDKNVRLKNEFKNLVNHFNELMKKFVPKQELFEKCILRFSRIVKILDYIMKI